MNLDDFLTFGVWLICLAPLVGLALLQRRRIHLVWLALAVAYLFVDFSALSLGLSLQHQFKLQLAWNWGGKIASLTLALLVFALSPELRAEAGATLRQSHKLLSLALLLLLSAAGVVLAVDNDPQPFSTEAALFQLTMPGFEEFAMRGIALALFTRALGTVGSIGSVSIGWGAITTMVFFAAVHGIFVQDGTVQFFSYPFVATGAVGAVLTAMRLTSGSLLLPVVGHALFDVAQTCLPMVGNR